MAFRFRGDRRWLRAHPLAGIGDGATYGCALIPGPHSRDLTVVFSGAEKCGWEHVSISTPARTPSWVEMCFVKDLFWDEEDAVMQLHPPKSRYVNHHSFCLHLWRPAHVAIPLPDLMLV
jgi:hypothetical protein